MRLMKVMFHLQTPAEGAAAAVSPELEGVGGCVVSEGHQIRSSAASLHQDLQAGLWRKTCDLLRLRDSLFLSYDTQCGCFTFVNWFNWRWKLLRCRHKWTIHYTLSQSIPSKCWQSHTEELWLMKSHVMIICCSSEGLDALGRIAVNVLPTLWVCFCHCFRFNLLQLCPERPTLLEGKVQWVLYRTLGFFNQF